MKLLLKLSAVTFQSLWKTLLVFLFLLSLAVNVTAFSVGTVATFISTAIETVTGVKTVVGMFRSTTADAEKLGAEAAASETKSIAMKTELKATKDTVAKMEGKVAGTELRLGSGPIDLI
jgi:hypothetical protein